LTRKEPKAYRNNDELCAKTETRRNGLTQSPSLTTSGVPCPGPRSFGSLSETTGQKYGIFKTAAVIRGSPGVDKEKKSSGRSSHKTPMSPSEGLSHKKSDGFLQEVV
jgi:hypothetical protein